MSQEQQDTPDYVRVTLTIHEFFEDGECCIVSDKHGHGTELSTDAFLHDAEDIDVGDIHHLRHPARSVGGHRAHPGRCGAT